MNLEYEKLLKEFFHILFSKSKNTKKYIRKIERPGKKTQYIYKNDIKLKQPGGKETRNTLQSENKKLLKKYPAFFKKKEVLQSLQKYKSFLKKNNKSLNGTGITKLEAFVIYHYSTYRGYSELNDNLRKKNPNPYTKQYSELLNNILSKLKPFKGIVYRGIGIPEKEFDRIEKCFENKIKYKGLGFVSTSLNEKNSIRYLLNKKNEGKVKVFFEIQSKSGKEISDFRVRPENKEVLFSKNSSFLIVDISEESYYYFVKMIEDR